MGNGKGLDPGDDVDDDNNNQPKVTSVKISSFWLRKRRTWKRQGPSMAAAAAATCSLVNIYGSVSGAQSRRRHQTEQTRGRVPLTVMAIGANAWC